MSSRFQASSAARFSWGVQSPGCLWILLLMRTNARCGIQFDQEVEDLFGLAAADGEHAVRGDLFDRLAVVVIHLELLLLVHRIRRFLADDDAFLEHSAAQQPCEYRRPR